MIKTSFTYILVFGLVLISPVSGFIDNQGKEFILSFMENISTRSKLYKIYVTTSKVGVVHVEVTSPKWHDPYLHEQFTITAGQVKSIDIGKNLSMTGTGISSKGILINSTEEVIVYGANLERSSSDVFLGLPTDIIGTEYYAVTHLSDEEKSEFLIVATEPYTFISIQLSNNTDARDVVYNGTIYKPGGNITLIMNRYDTFQVQSDGDLTGSYILSNKPISFFSGNIATEVGSKGMKGHLVEQLIPVEIWGSRFAVGSLSETIYGDYFKIVAGNCDVKILFTCGGNGNTLSTELMIKKAEYSQMFIGQDEYCYVESNNPVLLVQYSFSGGSTDATMIVIPSIEQYAADYIFTTPKPSLSNEDFNSSFLYVAKRQEVHELRLDGESVPNSTCSSIPKTDLCVGYLELSAGLHTIRHTSINSGFAGLLYGRRWSESYGFPLGFRLQTSDHTGYSSYRIDAVDCAAGSSVGSKCGKFNMGSTVSYVKSEFAWQEYGIMNEIFCALRCLHDSACLIFSYNKENQGCRGYERCAEN